jgi:molybdopterin molybdotransferase
MITPDEHLASILRIVTSGPTRTLPLSAALGLAVAEDLPAPRPLPRFDNSALDGYAVRFADLDGSAAPFTLPVVMDVAAGSMEQPPLPPGTAARIMTGARLPAGADTVVQVEFTDGGTQSVEVRRVVSAGTGVRRVGEDVAPGEVLVAAGQSLTAGRVGALASSGYAEVPVHRPVRVTVLATGAELVPPGHDLGWSGIHDSNTVVLAAALTGAAEPTTVTCRSDDEREFAAMLTEAAAGGDLVITTGGVSAGAYEVVKDHLGTLPEFTFGPVGIQPGKPQGFGLYRGTPVLCFPGNPVSAYVSLLLFGLPAIRRLGGHQTLADARPMGVLTESVARKPVQQYRRAAFDPQDGSVSIVGGAGSHLVVALARSNALAVIPVGEGALPAGDRVEVIHPIP